MASGMLTQIRRAATPARCYLCENAYQYARQAGEQEELCEEEAFYDLYRLCANCIEDETSSGNVREYVEPKLGRYVDYCAGFTSLTSWAAMATASATLATTADDEQSSATEASSTNDADNFTSSKVPVTASSTTAESDELDQPTSSSAPETKDSSGRNQAWIAGPIVPSVVVVLVLAGVGIWWYKRRKRTPKAPSSTQEDQETAQIDKPQLHSECVPRPSHVQVGSTPPTDQGHVHSPSYAEMPANEAPAHELSAEGRPRVG